jgi:hypothetical protein
LLVYDSKRGSARHATEERVKTLLGSGYTEPHAWSLESFAARGIYYYGIFMVTALTGMVDVPLSVSCEAGVVHLK